MRFKLVLLCLLCAALIAFAGVDRRHVRPENPYGVIRLRGSEAADLAEGARSLQDMLVRYRFTPGGYGEMQRRLMHVGVEPGIF